MRRRGQDLFRNLFGTLSLEFQAQPVEKAKAGIAL